MPAGSLNYDQFARFILRAGVAFAFLYPPINAWTNPYDWVGYFPSWMHGIVPDMVMLHAFGALEIIIALWLLGGLRVFWPAALATIMLIAIVAFNFSNFIVVFRDISIAAAAASIAIMEYPKRIPRWMQKE